MIWADLFAARERAALTLAESITTLPDDRSQEHDYADAAAALTGEELSSVAWVAIAMNSFNRLSIVSRHPVRATTATPPSSQPPHNGAPSTDTKETS